MTFVRQNFKPKARYNMTRNERPERFERTERKTGLGINKNSKALKFSYNDYYSLKTEVDDVKNEDLLRVLIARAHKEGQMPLKKCLEIVLRAMFHECNFPSLPPKSTYHQKSFNKTVNKTNNENVDTID
jgi:hypothetical protein